MMKLGEEYTKLVGNLQDNRTISGSTVGLQWLYSGSTVALQWLYSGSTVALQWLYSGSTVGLQWVYSGSRTNKRRMMNKSKLKLKDR